MKKEEENKMMEKIVSLCKRRGFVFQGSEIYGGLAGTWDWGHYGVALKNNIKQAWWRAILNTALGPNAAMPLLKAAVWFEISKVEVSYSGAGDVQKNFQISQDPQIAAALRTDGPGIAPLKGE